MGGFFYRTKANRCCKTSFTEAMDFGLAKLPKSAKKTRRRAFVRSMYFSKQKIFLDLFWRHLYQKNISNRRRRIRLLEAGLELIRKSKLEPSKIQNPNNSKEYFYKFLGKTKDGYPFCVQIKEYKRQRDS